MRKYFVISALFVLYLLGSVEAKNSQPPTLAEIFVAHNVPVGLLTKADVAKPLDHFAYTNLPHGFLLAYYEAESEKQDGSIDVLLYDTITRKLTRGSAVVPKTGYGEVDNNDPATEVSNSCTNIESIADVGGYFAVGTHINPSAECLLIFTPGLAFQKELDGWMLNTIDGDIVLQQSVPHFAAVHEAKLSVYDPKQNRLQDIYPAKDDPARQKFSAALKANMPPEAECRKNNLPCDPDVFSGDVKNLKTEKAAGSFGFDMTMSAEGFGSAEQKVSPQTVHYVCQQANGQWQCKPS